MSEIDTNARLSKYISFITKIFNMIETTDEFTTSGEFLNSIPLVIRFKRANTTHPMNSFRITSPDFSLEYNTTIKSAERFSLFLGEVIEHILNLYEDGLLRGA